MLPQVPGVAPMHCVELVRVHSCEALPSIEKCWTPECTQMLSSMVAGK